MATIQFSGVISGIDTTSIINGVLAVEGRSLAVLQLQKAKFQIQTGVFTGLSASLGSLKSSAQALSLSTDFNKRSVATSDKNTITAIADSTADLGSHNIVVDELAKSRSVQSTSFASTTADVTQGTLIITVGSTTATITVDSTNDDLTSLKDAINSSGAKVTASIVNVGISSSPDYRLVIQNKESGTDNALSLSGTLTDPGGSLNGHTEVQAAKDAVFFVNTLKVTRASNVVSDVISGVTFSLLTTSTSADGLLDTADPSATLTISADTGGISTQIGTFVSDYNAVADIVNGQFNLDAETKRQGALAGDSTLRSVMTLLRNVVGGTGGLGTGFLYLSDIGITFEEDGTLKVDSSKLDKSLEDDPTGVANLFLLTQDGIGKRVPDLIDDFISVVDGSITARQNGIASSISTLDNKIEREIKRITEIEERMKAKFAALEELISNLNRQASFLSQQFALLSRIAVRR